MSLKDTIHHLFEIVQNLGKDLAKASRGNKAASQRIRTGTIRLEKVGKKYRKESIAAEKTKRKPKRKKIPQKKCCPFS